MGHGTCPSCFDTAIQEHANGPVPSEPSREMLVKMRAIASDDYELPNHLRRVVVLFRRRIAVSWLMCRGSVR
jgi:hypothetical protein